MTAKKSSGRRLIVVTNRGPYHYRKTPQGLRESRTIGGLVSALDPLVQERKGIWVAWGDDGDIANVGTKLKVPRENPRYTLKMIRLTDDEVSNFYYGFANNTLWPLCHYFPEKCQFNERYWNFYKKVNRKFAENVLAELRKDDIVWIHDYHLALLPQYIRNEMPNVRMGIFWHIPFPAADIFNMLPWSSEVVRGMLHADLVGFHTNRYVNNFIETIEGESGITINRRSNSCTFDGIESKVRNFPISIDYGLIQHIARQPKTIERAARIQDTIQGKHLILGVDRLDYSKGILERLKAIDLFYEKYPEFRGKVTFMQIAVPSRTKIVQYHTMKREIEEAVGRINGKFGQIDWMPIYYFYKGFPFEELMAYYRAADIALLTPLRDGMNLVAKEYVSAQVDENGVLILSKFAGASEELKNALIINPYNLHEVADTLAFAMRMNEFERKEQLKWMRRHIEQYDIYWWVRKFLSSL